MAHVALLVTKSKRNPVEGLILRWMATHMRTVADALKEFTPQVTEIYMLGDSRKILKALKAGATLFNEWFANRLGEV